MLFCFARKNQVGGINFIFGYKRVPRQVLFLSCRCRFSQYQRLLQAHRTKCQESADCNVAETRENVAETQRLTCVSGGGYTPFIPVSVAAVMTEPDHFFVCFRRFPL